MENPIIISNINDFVFCPLSIYFHNLYEGIEKETFQSDVQINGIAAHKSIDTYSYSSRKHIIQAIEIYCERYNLVGKIDIFDISTKTIIERKKKIKTLFEGYYYQVYAQYFALIEMGYEVENIFLHSLDDNKRYRVELPSKNAKMMQGFECIISQMETLDLSTFIPENKEKCNNCIYSNYCDRSLADAI